MFVYWQKIDIAVIHELIPYCLHEFITHSVILHFLTETCISYSCNNVVIHKPHIHDLEKEKNEIWSVYYGSEFCSSLYSYSLRLILSRLQQVLRTVPGTIFVSFIFGVCVSEITLYCEFIINTSSNHANCCL